MRPHPTHFRKLTMSLTEEESAGLVELVSAIWGSGVAANLNYNEEVIQVISDATEQMNNCSSQITLLFLSIAGLPVATGIIPFGKPWVRKFAMDIAKAIKDNKDDGGWINCVKQAAAIFRHRLELASLGA